MAQRKMKTSGKLIIVGVLIAATFGILYTTGIWQKITTTSGTTVTTKCSERPDGSLPPVGLTEIRLAHWTWNSHQAWAYANQGKCSGGDSLFAQNKIKLQFNLVEEIPKQIAALKAFASAVNKGAANPSKGVHFFTIMGDAGGWVMNDTNKALKAVNPAYEAEIIGFSGFSSGEDKFMGPPAWKKDPQKAKGGVVSGVAADGDWNIMIFWCSQNQIPFNSNKKTYNPNALNFVETDSYIAAGEVYIAGKPVPRTFIADGVDYKGRPVKKGKKGKVAINGVVTWTPVDKNIADKKGGLVSIASTKEYSNQMPQFIIGLKQWNQKNKPAVENMLTAIFQASDQIIDSDKRLKSGDISPKSAEDNRWLAAQYTQQMFNSETADYWYTYYSVVDVKDKEGLTVEVGGSSVSNLSRNIKYFGLDGSEDIGSIVYYRFAKLAKYYYPDFISAYPAWDRAFNPAYLRSVAAKHPNLAKSDPYLPKFTAANKSAVKIGELLYRIPFQSGKASFSPRAAAVLKKALSQLVIAANSRVEIHGHTDTQGEPGPNMELSKQRAAAVSNWLRSRAGSSFPSGRVQVIPHGESVPLVKDNKGGRFIPAKMARNRRVVVKIFKN